MMPNSSKTPLVRRYPESILLRCHVERLSPDSCTTVRPVSPLLALLPLSSKTSTSNRERLLTDHAGAFRYRVTSWKSVYKRFSPLPRKRKCPPLFDGQDTYLTLVLKHSAKEVHRHNTRHCSP